VTGKEAYAHGGGGGAVITRKYPLKTNLEWGEKSHPHRVRERGECRTGKLLKQLKNHQRLREGSKGRLHRKENLD